MPVITRLALCSSLVPALLHRCPSAFFFYFDPLSRASALVPSPPLPVQAAGCYYSPASLAAMCAAYLPLMGLSAALAIPGGLFMPSMMVGGSFGALAGFALRAALPGMGVQPGLYALCCATAVLGGVFRSSISLAVLMMEATGAK